VIIFCYEYYFIFLTAKKPSRQGVFETAKKPWHHIKNLGVLRGLGGSGS
jgi:hypothetical protein